MVSPPQKERIRKMRKELKEIIRKHNQICKELELKGYVISGCSKDNNKCYFSNGVKPFGKVVGYINNKTLDVVVY